MIARRSAAAAACAAALALVACGGSDEPARPGGEGPGARPQRQAGGGAGLHRRTRSSSRRRLVGEQSIQVGAEGGPRIEFLISGGEAEGRQFQGDAQGAEQIGSTLLYLNDGTEDQIEKIEKCLDDQ